MPITFTPSESGVNIVQDSPAVTGRGLSPKTVRTVTDVDGFASIDLLRGQLYHVFVGGYAVQTWSVYIPDLAASALPDVVYPYPTTCEFRDNNAALLLPSASPTISVLQGVTAVLDLTTVFRSGHRITGLKGLSLQADTNHWMVDARLQDHQLTLTGLSPGVIIMTLAGREDEVVGCGARITPVQVFFGNLIITVTDDALIADLVDPADGTLGAILTENT